MCKSISEHVMRHGLKMVLFCTMVGRDTIYCPAGFSDHEDKMGQIQEGDWRRQQDQDVRGLRSVQPTHARNFTQEACNVRNRFTNIFMSAQGSIEWQWTIPGLQGLM